MKKQIILDENILMDIHERVKQYIEILNYFNRNKLTWKSEINIDEKNSIFLYELRTIPNCELKKLFTKKKLFSKVKFSKFEIKVDHLNIIELILFGVRNEVCMSIDCGDVRLVLNDNDGNSIIFNSNKVNFREVKEEINRILN